MTRRGPLQCSNIAVWFLKYTSYLPVHLPVPAYPYPYQPTPKAGKANPSGGSVALGVITQSGRLCSISLEIPSPRLLLS